MEALSLIHICVYKRQAEELRCGAVYPQSGEADAELMVLDLSGLSKEDDRSAAQALSLIHISRLALYEPGEQFPV